MNPPQLVQEVVTALQHQNWLLILCLAIVLVVYVMGLLVQLYIAKKIEAKITNQQHFSRLVYEHELTLYREVWKKLLSYHEKASFVFTWEEKNRDDRAKELRLAGDELFSVIRDNKPFYPDEVWNELRKAVDLCDEMSRTQQNMKTASDKLMPEFRDKLDKLQQQAKAQQSIIEERIRNRLAKFAGQMLG